MSYKIRLLIFISLIISAEMIIGLDHFSWRHIAIATAIIGSNLLGYITRALEREYEL